MDVNKMAFVNLFGWSKRKGIVCIAAAVMNIAR